MGGPDVYWYKAYLQLMKRRCNLQCCLLDLQCHILSFDYIKVVVAESIPRDTTEQFSSRLRVGVGIRLPFGIFFHLLTCLQESWDKVRESVELLSALLRPHLNEKFGAETRSNLSAIWNLKQ